jgi:hypothetical protein
VALGYTIMLLAIVGAFRGRPRPVVRALAGMWIVSALIALGPTLHFNDVQVHIWGRAVPLPARLLYAVLPGAASMRVMARFGFWTGLATAGLAALGIVHIVERARATRRRTVVIVAPALAVVAVMVESVSVFPMLSLAPREVDRWLAKQSADTVIVEMPVEQGTRPFQNYWATEHGRIEVFGWNGDSFPPPERAERIAALKDFPLAESVAYLRSLGVTYVIVRPRQIDDWDFLKPLVDRAPALRFDRPVGDALVYRVLRQ